jgi:tryptophan 7-halogenase
MNKRVDKVLVLGGGSAGFLAAITIRHRLPQLPITVVRSKDIGIIGVGEGTTVVLPQHLHDYLKIDLGEFFRVAQPQWKLGIRFLWGKRPYFNYTFARELDTQYQLLQKTTGYYCNGSWDYMGIQSGLMTHNRVYVRDSTGWPVLGGDVAYHLENEQFVGFLEGHARKLGIAIEDDTVEEVLQGDNGISGLRMVSGRTKDADLYVDCSGFASVLLGRTLGESFVSFKKSLFNDRAVVGGWQRAEEPIKPYTTAETMNSGWCWQIDHETRINRGYVYSSDFISDDEAEKEFRQKNPKVENTRIVRFRTGRFERGWVKNVVAIGNSSGFVEPLEATSLGGIAVQCQAVAESLVECDRFVYCTLATQYNRRNAFVWDEIRRFLAIHFKFNERLETPYWQACRADADLDRAQEIVDYFREVGPSLLWRQTLLESHNQFGLEGYYSMLLGQQVPFKFEFRPTAQDQQNWQRIQQSTRNKVMQAYTPKEMMALVRSDMWQWPSRVYKQNWSARS